MNGMAILSGNANPSLAQEIARVLKTSLTNVLVGRFSEGEIRVQIQENIRGRDVFIIQPTCPPTNENLMELLILIDATRRASAQRITAVMPYYGYGRQDRKDQPRVPITAKLVANLICAAGADRLLTMDLHPSQNRGFDIPSTICTALRAVNIASKGFKRSDLVVVTSDVGASNGQGVCETAGREPCHRRETQIKPRRHGGHAYLGNGQGQDCGHCR